MAQPGQQLPGLMEAGETRAILLDQLRRKQKLAYRCLVSQSGAT